MTPPTVGEDYHLAGCVTLRGLMKVHVMLLFNANTLETFPRTIMVESF